ncbi:hypothetical protein Tco_0583914 [Tanacetum coccineum]
MWSQNDRQIPKIRPWGNLALGQIANGSFYDVSNLKGISSGRSIHKDGSLLLQERIAFKVSLRKCLHEELSSSDVWKILNGSVEVNPLNDGTLDGRFGLFLMISPHGNKNGSKLGQWKKRWLRFYYEASTGSREMDQRVLCKMVDAGGWVFCYCWLKRSITKYAIPDRQTIKSSRKAQESCFRTSASLIPTIFLECQKCLKLKNFTKDATIKSFQEWFMRMSRVLEVAVTRWPKLQDGRRDVLG